MNPKIPVIVQDILNEYICLLNKHLPNTIKGLYIHGSIALNAFTNGSSDIDFVACVNRNLTRDDVKILSKMHKGLNQKYKKLGMDGCYLLQEDVGKKQLEVKKCLYVNEGKIKWSNEVINPITWWILKSKGITVFGPDVTVIHFDVNENVLVEYVLNNMNTYWANRLKTIEKYKNIAILLPNKLIDLEIEWSIAGILRQFYTLKERDIVSKLDACTYAVNHVPERWHNIIRDAKNIREGLNERYCVSKKDRIHDTIQCINFVLNHCNSLYKKDIDK